MLKQSIQQKLGLKINPLQIQFIRLLELPTYQLEQRIKEELEQNPLLEEGSEEQYDMDISTQDAENDNSVDEEFDNDYEDVEHEFSQEDEFSIDDYISDDDDIPDYKLTTSNTSPDDDSKDYIIQQGASFRESLINQLGTLSLDESDLKLAEYIIGNIDDDGYLRRDIENIVDDLAFGIGLETDDNKIEYLLRLIQGFEPIGVGARDLRECLLIQLKYKCDNQATNSDINNALLIVKDSFDDFSRKHYDKIARRLRLNDEELKEAISIIIKLNPKPGNSIDSVVGHTSERIIPDFTLDLIDGELQLSLNSGDVPELRINKSYANMIKDSNDKKQQELTTFVKYKLSSARSFIDAIQQRHNTLMMTMSAIIQFQKTFFLSGDERQLEPMILKDIADITGLDISTISRVSNSKHVQTWFGIYALKTFFSGSMQTTSGEDVSTGKIKNRLKAIINKENKKKPLTDDELVDMLKEDGYQIARRTIAKYRQMLDIPVARLRKEI